MGGDVYDITGFQHPGGQLVLKRFLGGTLDAQPAFNDINHSEHAIDMLQYMKVGTLTASEKELLEKKSFESETSWQTTAYILGSLLVISALTLFMYVFNYNITSKWTIYGTTRSGTFYPWELVDGSVATNITVWVLYVSHNLFTWAIIFYVRRKKPAYSNDMRWWNWAMFWGNLLFSIAHIVQTHYQYDGLA